MSPVEHRCREKRRMQAGLPSSPAPNPPNRMWPWPRMAADKREKLADSAADELGNAGDVNRLVKHLDVQFLEQGQVLW